MTDGKLLRETIDASGISISFIAGKLNKSRNRVYSIVKGADCTASEITVISECLHLNTDERDKIFFAPKCE